MNQQIDQRQAETDLRRGKRTRRLSAGTIAALGLFLALSHQNCAPAKTVSGATGSTSTGTQASEPVTIIDDSKSDAAVSFSASQLAVAAALPSVDVVGNCSLTQNDSVLGWQLVQGSVDGNAGAEVQRGYASCKQGQFVVHVEGGASLPCGSYNLVAQLGFGSPGAIALNVACR